MRDYKRFWIEDKLQNIAREKSEVQGDWKIIPYLSDLQVELRCKTVLDFGCGWGRLAPAFNTATYLGVDLNPHAIKDAQRRYPKFKNRFFEINMGSAYPHAEMYLAFTVFLHMDDDALHGVVSRMHFSCKKYLVVIETLGREWRNETGLLPRFNRNFEDYVELIEDYGFYFYKQDVKHKPHYESMPGRYVGRNTDTNILIFQRNK